MDEIWKPIPGYEGLYEASNLGRIRSVDRELVQRNNKGGVSVFRRKGRILAQRMSSAGYLRVNLSKDDEHSTHHVHKLICLAFYGIPENGRDQAAHNDGTRTNNVLSNLRWATLSENMQDKNLHGTDMRGDKHPKAKLNWKSVRAIRASNDNAPALAASLGVGVSAIRKVRYGYTWKEEHAGRPSVRRATPEDRLAVFRLLKDSHAAAGFTFPFSAPHADALFRQHLERGLVLVCGQPVRGVLMASTFEHPFGAGKWAKETCWYIAPEARGRSALQMLGAYEAWAREQGCTTIGMASLAANDVSRIYERRGYAPAETHFVKSLR